MRSSTMRVPAMTILATLAAAAPATAATPFDGTYRGSYTPAGNGNARCPAGTEFSVNVVDGRFPYGGAGDGERVTATVAPDGSFSAQSGQRYLQGRIQGRQMTATTSGSRCNYTWSLTR